MTATFINDPTTRRQLVDDDPSDPKQWYRSKTVWLNALLTLSAVGLFFAEPKNNPAMTLPSLSAAVVGVVNVVLRVWFTAAPIAGTRLAFRVMAAQAERAATTR